MSGPGGAGARRHRFGALSLAALALVLLLLAAWVFSHRIDSLALAAFGLPTLLAVATLLWREASLQRHADSAPHEPPVPVPPAVPASPPSPSDADLPARSEARHASAAAQARIEAESALLAGMERELRKPLQAVLDMAQALETTRLDADQRHLTQSLRGSAAALQSLLAGMLDFARAESGTLVLAREPFLLPQLLQRLVLAQVAGAADKGVVLDLTALPEGLPPLLGDAPRLEQLLSALVDNAIRHGAAGRVSVAVRVLERDARCVRLHFAVTDMGRGIPPARLERLFQAHVRPGGVPGRHGEVRLGLALARALATLMGGDVGARSQPGMGSELWFTVALDVAPAAAAAAQHAAAPGPAGDARTGSAAPDLAPRSQRLAGLRLLVVDDGLVNREVACRLLAAEGALCATAEHGLQALEMLRAVAAGPVPFDAMFLDVQMPVLDGLETVRRLRADPALAALPVIALSAGTLPHQQQAALDAGMDEFMAKPIQLDAMVAALRRRLGPRMPAQAPSSSPSPAMEPRPIAVEDALPTVPGVDRADAARRLQGNRPLFLSMLRMLRDEFGAAPARSRADVARGDLAGAAGRLHRLCGLAGNLSARAVAAAAGNAEAALRDGDGDAGAVERELRALELALAEVLAGLPPEVDRPWGDAAAAPDGGAAQDDPATIDALLAALDEGDMGVFQLYHALRSALAARHGHDAVDRLDEAMDQLRFTEAIALLRAWYPKP